MSLDLHIVTPEGEAYRGTVQSVVVPGELGSFGVLPGHERVLAPVDIGEVEIREDGGSRFAAVSVGFAEVTADRVVLMVETCELAEEIDVARAERARAQAERELEELRRAREEESRRFKMAEAALRRAVVRLAVAQRARGRDAA